MDLTSLMTSVEEMDIDSRYRVVILTAQRARQIMQGSKPQVSTKFNKESTVALQEAIDGKIDYITGPDARAALREARMKESIPRPRPLPAPTENSSEIKKDLTQHLDDSKPKPGESKKESEA